LDFLVKVIVFRFFSYYLVTVLLYTGNLKSCQTCSIHHKILKQHHVDIQINETHSTSLPSGAQYTVQNNVLS